MEFFDIRFDESFIAGNDKKGGNTNSSKSTTKSKDIKLRDVMPYIEIKGDSTIFTHGDGQRYVIPYQPPKQK